LIIGEREEKRHGFSEVLTRQVRDVKLGGVPLSLYGDVSSEALLDQAKNRSELLRVVFDVEIFESRYRLLPERGAHSLGPQNDVEQAPALKAQSSRTRL